MKKVLMIIGVVLIYLLGFFGYINAEASTTDTLSSPHVTNNVVYLTEQVKQAVSSIAEGLKAPAEHVYSVLVKQRVINAVSNIFIYLILITLSYISIRWTVGKYDPEEDCYDGVMWDGYKYDINGWIFLPLVVTGATILIIGGSMSTTISGLLNPEYFAIQEILSIIK